LIINASPIEGLIDAEDACATAVGLLRRDLWPIALHSRGAMVAGPHGPLPAKGSEPIGKAWGCKRPTEAGLRAIYQAHPGAGVGIRLGRDGGVIDIEVDGDAGHASLVNLIGGEPATLGWLSRRGPHHLFLYEFRFNSLASNKFVLAEFPGLEFRIGADGQLQSACPPTVGLDGQPRRWNGHDRIERLPEPAIERILAGARRKRATPPTPSADRRPAPAAPRTAYGAAALRRECDIVAATPEGSRHGALEDAALRVASLAKADTLDWHEARQQLADAADQCGLPRPESEELLDWAYRRADARVLHIFFGGKGEPQDPKVICNTSSRGESLERAKARIPVVDVPSELAGNPRLEPLARVMIAFHEEAIRRGEETFYASYETIGDLASQPNRMTTMRRLGAISKLGHLSKVKPGVAGPGPTGMANWWQWHDPPRPGETIWKKATKSTAPRSSPGHLSEPGRRRPGPSSDRQERIR
jgi:hypothetical protein